MDDILITGGAGFIGSHLAERLLRNGKRLAIVDNLDDFYAPELKRANLEEIGKNGEFEFYPVDIREGAKLREVFAKFKPAAVVHLAARAGVRQSFAQPDEYASVNVVGTTQLLEACRQSAVQHFVFASSSSVYGYSSQGPFREDAGIAHPLSVYAATKVAGEALGFTYSHAYALPVTCLRLFTVYGPRQRPDLAIRKFAGMILEGKEVPIFGDGSLRRDYTYIDDIVDGILQALGVPHKFEVFNLGNCHPVSINEMVDTLGRSLGRSVHKKFVPTPAGEMTLTHAELSKARRMLGYAPKIGFQEGIQKFAEWMKPREQRPA